MPTHPHPPRCGEPGRAPQGFFPAGNGGIPAILFRFLFLYTTLAGGGAWSLDARLARRRGRGDASHEEPRLRQVA